MGMHHLSKFLFFFVFKWKLKGEFPKNLKQYILIAAPHTSWIDVPLGILIRAITKTNIHFIGKKSLFKLPQGILFRSLGGFPVDRTVSNNTVTYLVRKFEENPNFILGLSPEGTRQKVEKWKTGFYYIAKGANVPIVRVILDYQNKKVTILPPYYLTDTIENDMPLLKQAYKGINGKHPEFS